MIIIKNADKILCPVCNKPVLQHTQLEAKECHRIGVMGEFK